MTAPKAGYKGAVYIGAQKVGGSTNWSYSGETRNMQDVDEFEEEDILSMPLQITGGEITIAGNCLMGDAGQVLLETKFADKSEITDLKLYISKADNTYYTPDPAIFMGTTPSHCIVTSVRAVGDDKSGVGSFSATLKVNGRLKRVS